MPEYKKELVINIKSIIGIAIIILLINPLLFLILFVAVLSYSNARNKKNTIQNINTVTEKPVQEVHELSNILILPSNKYLLNKKKKYLHIALNNSLTESLDILSQLPSSERILIEVGTPLIKRYGVQSIEQIKSVLPYGTYIIADGKCTDMADTEVKQFALAGASACTCLGSATIETIKQFIASCKYNNMQSFIDMMNVVDPLTVLKQLPQLPDVVMLHRGVDETQFSKEKQIPYYQIKQIKGTYNVLIAVAGADTMHDVQHALFNGADIVVVWKSFYQVSTDTTQLAQSFLQEVS